MGVFSKLYENKVNDLKNNIEQQDKANNFFIRNFFTEYIINTWKWSGMLPEFIKKIPEYVEECFLYHNCVAFFENDGKYFLAPAFPSGRILENGRYSNYTMVMRNGQIHVRSIDDIELCFNNSIGLSSLQLIDEIINKCSTALNAVDSALIKASYPKLCNIPEETDIDKIITNVNDSLRCNKKISIFSSKNWSDESLKTYDIFDNKTNDVIALWDVFDRYKNLGLTWIGIHNVDILKKERLTETESKSNEESIEYGLIDDMNYHRQEFVKNIKDHFNIDIKVMLNRKDKENDNIESNVNNIKATETMDE